MHSSLAQCAPRRQPYTMPRQQNEWRPMSDATVSTVFIDGYVHAHTNRSVNCVYIHREFRPVDWSIERQTLIRFNRSRFSNKCQIDTNSDQARSRSRRQIWSRSNIDIWPACKWMATNFEWAQTVAIWCTINAARKGRKEKADDSIDILLWPPIRVPSAMQTSIAHRIHQCEIADSKRAGSHFLAKANSARRVEHNL